MAKWQQEWNSAKKGRWTHRLIPNLPVWLDRKHGEANFHLTQFLSGHGCFRKYLHRCGHATSPCCPACAEIEETPEHVIFDCPRFGSIRSTMLVISRADTSPDNIVHRMRLEEDTWNAIDRAIAQIVSALQRKLREDQRVAIHSLESIRGNRSRENFHRRGTLRRGRLDPPPGTS